MTNSVNSVTTSYRGFFLRVIAADGGMENDSKEGKAFVVVVDGGWRCGSLNHWLLWPKERTSGIRSRDPTASALIAFLKGGDVFILFDFDRKGLAIKIAAHIAEKSEHRNGEECYASGTHASIVRSKHRDSVSSNERVVDIYLPTSSRVERKVTLVNLCLLTTTLAAP
jgi:5S rRNA maturation endonuclease (ribonuclease M5)